MTNLAVFASGRGSNFQVIHKNIKEGFIQAKISLLITDNEKAAVIDFARENQIPVCIIRPKDFPTVQAFGEALLNALVSKKIEFIILAGYLKKIPANVIHNFQNSIVNIHPALLPAFGGKGMYGIRVHQAVYESGAKISGVTVHLVNDEYDNGPIVLQKAVDITNCRSPEEIASKVLLEEHLLFPRAIKSLLENKISIEGNRVIIGNKKNDHHQTSVN